MKTLTEEMLSTADKALVIKHLKKWMMEKLEEEIFPILVKKLNIWVEKAELQTPEQKTQVIQLVYELLSCENALNDVDRQRVLKRLVKMMCINLELKNSPMNGAIG